MSHPDFAAWSGDEPDPYDLHAVDAEKERLIEAAREAAQTETYLVRTACALARDVSQPALSRYEVTQMLRAALVRTWNEARRKAARHDSLGVERPQP